MATAEIHAIRDAAAAYGQMGFRVIPLHSQKNGCCHCSKGFACKSGGKHPVHDDWQNPEITFEPVRDFSRPRNLGIATGPASNLLVVDVDTDEGKPGLESMAALIADNEELPKTYTVKTGGGGFQLYFRYDGDDIGNSSGKLGPGLDTRGKGGYVVAPPSVSTKGEYRAVRQVPIAPLPEWLAAKLRKKVRETPAPTERTESHGDERLKAYEDAIIQAETARLQALEPAGWDLPWDQTTFEVACNLVELANAEWSNLTLKSAENIVYDSVPEFDDEGWDLDRVAAKIESARTKVGDNATPLPDDRPDEQETLHAMAGETYTPSEPAAESAVKPRAEVPAPEVTAFTDDLPEPTTEDQELARQVEPWVTAHLVAGSQNLFWEVVGAVLTADGQLPVHVAIKGAPSLTAALTDSLGAIPGPEEGVLYAGGVAFSNTETDNTTVVLEFDEDLNLTSGTLSALRDVAISSYHNALEDGWSSADEEIATRDVGDYRINSALRAHIGQRRQQRGDADEFNMGG